MLDIGAAAIPGGERPIGRGPMARGMHGASSMSLAFLLVVAGIAIATVLLWPLRAWIASRYDRPKPKDEPPLTPPKRRHRG
ncbi:MAG: hypothetical protein DLM71_01005 [Chloroflexi bacterium]|nr:MAG: hypothetical protein DLM71_01005 [Chloroflexota bacterium]